MLRLLRRGLGEILCGRFRGCDDSRRGEPLLTRCALDVSEPEAGLRRARAIRHGNAALASANVAVLAVLRACCHPAVCVFDVLLLQRAAR